MEIGLQVLIERAAKTAIREGREYGSGNGAMATLSPFKHTVPSAHPSFRCGNSKQQYVTSPAKWRICNAAAGEMWSLRMGAGPQVRNMSRQDAL